MACDGDRRGSAAMSLREAEWEHDIGNGLFLVMKRSMVGYCAALDGFRGLGSTQESALDDLLASMTRYCESADDFLSSLAPGGRLHEKLRQISVLVDQISQEQQS